MNVQETQSSFFTSVSMTLANGERYELSLNNIVQNETEQFKVKQIVQLDHQQFAIWLTRSDDVVYCVQNNCVPNAIRYVVNIQQEKPERVTSGILWHLADKTITDVEFNGYIGTIPG